MNNTLKSYFFPLLIISSLYFMWGFVTNLNDILIPHLKRACELNDFQSAFVQFAFFGAYFFMSIPAGYVLKKIGYKKGMVLGLLICCFGALLFIPSANSRIYIFFLISLGILATGITLLQVAANPYVSILGPSKTAASRISIVGTFNSIGASISPFIGGIIILSKKSLTSQEIGLLSGSQKIAYLNQEAASVKLPYMVLAGCLLAIALLIYFSNIPEIKESSDEETENSGSSSSILQHRNLVWGVVAIFAYVGAEVAIGSFLIRYGQSLGIPGYTEIIGSQYVSRYMLGAMIGRVLGIFYLPKVKATNALIVKSILAILLISLSLISSGYFALWCIVLCGFCNSIMWPVIFPLAINGLGKFTKKGSSFLIAGIVGGAIIPLIVGYISDAINTQTAFVVPGICYFFILFYAINGHKQSMLKKTY